MEVVSDNRIEVLGFQSVAIPPPRLVALAGFGPRKRLWIASSLAPQNLQTESLGNAEGPASPLELFGLAYALMLMGLRAMMGQAKYRLGIRRHRI